MTIYQNAQGCGDSNQANFTHLVLLNIFLKEKFRVITFPGYTDERKGWILDYKCVHNWRFAAFLLSRGHTTLPYAVCMSVRCDVVGSVSIQKDLVTGITMTLAAVVKGWGKA